MIETLAEAAATTAPTALQTYGPVGAVLLALGGWKGIAQGVLWLQGRNGNGRSSPVAEKDCHRRHDDEAKMRAIENGQLVKAIDKLDGSVTRLHERIDEYLRKK